MQLLLAEESAQADSKLSWPDRCAGGGLCRVPEGLHGLARPGGAAGQRGRSAAAALPQTLPACRGVPVLPGPSARFFLADPWHLTQQV